jgi:hypothetical protein
MSTTFSSPVTADDEQRQLLHVPQRYASNVSGIRESSLKTALKAVRKATHRSPLLPVLGPAGIRELKDRLIVLVRWLRTQPTIQCDLRSQDPWLEQKREERRERWEEDVTEEQWVLVREIATALKNKRIVHEGDRELLGL